MDKYTQESLDFMQNPERWPNLILPIKRSGEGAGWPELGCMVEGQPVVYLCSMFDFNTANKIAYPTYEAVVEDGWRVD